MTVKGTVDYRPAAVDGDITLTANSGGLQPKDAGSGAPRDIWRG